MPPPKVLEQSKNLIVILGPTASGKTSLGVALAHDLGGEVVSADSRQVYRGLDIGAGKDLAEYTYRGKDIPYHLIDIVDLDREFSVFDFQREFFDLFVVLRESGKLPVMVGGTGLYLESVLEPYPMVRVPENPMLRAELNSLSEAELCDRLRTLKPKLHNTTDLETRERLVRAIEIETFAKDNAPPVPPELRPVILGTQWDPVELRARIRLRLEERMKQGLVEEVENLHRSGIPWDRLDKLGLEYRFVANFLLGKIANSQDLIDQLHRAICKFAKRQRTWFRRMERRGHIIHWITGNTLDEARYVLAGFSIDASGTQSIQDLS